LAGAQNWQCDWEQIVNLQEGQLLDLSDPFTREESWRRVRPADRRSTYSAAGGDDGIALERDRLARRLEATDRVLAGDYAGAEALLRGLLQEAFEVANSHCHLARALMMMNREGEARDEINQAWAAREQAATYTVARILFFQCLFAMLDGVAIDPIVGQIRDALERGGAHMDWTILPMLNHMRSRLGEANYQFLKALAGALCEESGLLRLDEFAQWRGEANATSPQGARATGDSPRRRWRSRQGQ